MFPIDPAPDTSSSDNTGPRRQGGRRCRAFVNAASWAFAAVLAVACNAGPTQAEESETRIGPMKVTAMAQLNEPWAMTFLPDGRLLVTEKPGRLLLLSLDGREPVPIEGLPEVDYGGQGGLGEVVLHPDYENNGLIYLGYAEAGEGNRRGAAVLRARLEISGNTGSLRESEVIWRQEPKVTGRGHYAHRIAFSEDGHLFLTSGDRQKMSPAQDLDTNLGKVLRLNDDGTLPADNPFAEQGGVAAQVWTLGHRNPLGIAFDREGRLWAHEMGPRHGDELNLIEPALNYGWPEVSWGNHYDGRLIPDHDERPEFEAPGVYWVPAISPAGLLIYSGDLFPQWRGNAFIGGLSSQSLIRVEFDGAAAVEAERFDMGQRIREIEQGPDGALWVLEDERPRGSGGRLLRLAPAEGGQASAG